MSLFSPRRQQLEEENREFQALNHRFEYYILQQREKDAAQTGLDRELRELQLKNEALVNQATQRHQDQVAMFQEQITHAQSSMKALNNDMIAAKATNAQLSSIRDAQFKSVSNQEDLYRADYEELIKWQNEHDTAYHRPEANEAMFELTKEVEAQLDPLQEEYEEKLKLLQDEKATANELRAQIELEKVNLVQAQQEAVGAEPELFKQFGETARALEEERQASLLAEVNQSQAERNQQNLDTITHLYEQKLLAYRSQLELLQSELNEVVADVPENGIYI